MILIEEFSSVKSLLLEPQYYNVSVLLQYIRKKKETVKSISLKDVQLSIKISCEIFEIFTKIFTTYLFTNIQRCFEIFVALGTNFTKYKKKMCVEVCYGLVERTESRQIQMCLNN